MGSSKIQLINIYVKGQAELNIEVAHLHNAIKCNTIQYNTIQWNAMQLNAM